jgi:hypothetical protein
MRILESSPSRLVIADRPWGIPLLCLGLAVPMAAQLITTFAARTPLERGALVLSVVSCTAMAWVSASRTTLTLDSGADTFDWQRQFGLGFRRRGGSFRLSQVERAEVESRLFDDGRSWRSSLIVNGERLALTEWFGGSESRQQAFVDQVNSWLAHLRARPHS